MTNPEKYRSGQEDAHTSQWFSSGNVPGSTSWNVLKGTVISRAQGLTRTTLRIRVGEQTNLRVRWPASAPGYDAVDVGQIVCVSIPVEAVHLEAGGFRRGKQRWNRWIGRVVLVDQNHDEPVTTVKVHRDNITLKSCVPVIGGPALLKTWDTVNIVVDPQQVRLTPLNQTYSSPNSVSTYPAVSHPTSVWLRAAIRSLRWGPAGHDVALNVGGVNFSALVEADKDALEGWTVGMFVEINICEHEAWIRLDAQSPLLPCGVAFSSVAEEPRFSNPIR